MTGKSSKLGREYPPEGEELLIEQILTISKFSMDTGPILLLREISIRKVMVTLRESLSLKEISLMISR
jgi:hypothetical protein